MARTVRRDGQTIVTDREDPRDAADVPIRTAREAAAMARTVRRDGQTIVTDREDPRDAADVLIRIVREAAAMAVITVRIREDSRDAADASPDSRIPMPFLWQR